MVPNACTSGLYQNIAVSDPVVDIRIYNDDTLSTYKIYSEQFNYPLLVTQSTEWATWRIDVKYTWFDYPFRDYTVNLHSRNLAAVADGQKRISKKNYDGSNPSAFPDYFGMDWEFKIKTFAQLWQVAQMYETPWLAVIWLFFGNPAVLFPWNYF